MTTQQLLDVLSAKYFKVDIPQKIKSNATMNMEMWQVPVLELMQSGAVSENTIYYWKDSTQDLVYFRQGIPGTLTGFIGELKIFLNSLITSGTILSYIIENYDNDNNFGTVKVVMADKTEKRFIVNKKPDNSLQYFQII